MSEIDDLISSIAVPAIARRLAVDRAEVLEAIRLVVPALLEGFKYSVVDSPEAARHLLDVASRQRQRFLVEDKAIAIDSDSDANEAVVSEFFGGSSNSVAADIVPEGQTNHPGLALTARVLPLVAPIVLVYVGGKLVRVWETEWQSGFDLDYLLLKTSVPAELKNFAADTMLRIDNEGFTDDVWPTASALPRAAEELRDDDSSGGDSGTPPRGPHGNGGGGSDEESPRPRYLQATMPEKAETGRQFSLRVAITLTGSTASSSALKTLFVPPQGAPVTISVSAPGLLAESDLQQPVTVPPAADSDPCLFDFKAAKVGLYTVKVEVFRKGSFLGAIRLQIAVEESVRHVIEGVPQYAELPDVSVQPGEVTLQIFRSAGRSYRFQLLGDAFYGDVPGRMSNASGAVTQLVTELRSMAANRSEYATSALVRDRLKSLGIQLWLTAVPEAIQRQFWEQADGIKMFTIASDNDNIPWELLYPANGDNDRGFLAEQFPVVRRAYAQRRWRKISVGKAAYVVPPAGAPSDAMAEVEAIQALLGTGTSDGGVLSELSAVRQLVLRKDLPGIMHFACHNSFSGKKGSSIKLGGGPWRPSDLAEAKAKTTLATSRPMVFFNACRSAGEIPWFGGNTGWASEFIEAGAGAFIGSLWAVRSRAAKAFAENFYKEFVVDGQTLGTSSLRARQAVADDGGDPTWLSYTVYGNPAAVVERI